MSSNEYVGAIDQGTTGTRFIIFDSGANPVGAAYREHEQIFPKPGWVEHNPAEIWENTEIVVHEALEDADLETSELAAIGITNQRETTLVWDADSGEALHNAIVWQDRRTSNRCSELREAGMADTIMNTTGLQLDPYFSGTKLEWLLNNVGAIRPMAREGQALFGTVESWLIWKLTDGDVHVTDYTNASRTLLFDISKLHWDKELLDTFDVPSTMLPEPRPNIEQYGRVQTIDALQGVPIGGALGDQQAALFGEGCFEKGEGKNTYGTGSFLLLNIGTTPDFGERLLTSVGFADEREVHYVLEGSVFVTGAAIQWLRDELQIIESAPESEELANRLDDNEGVYLVPAFAGLGAPHWDAQARGTIVGLTRGSGRAHFARAALESIVYQTEDVLKAMKDESDVSIAELRVDGGAAQNDFICQFQSDISRTPITRMEVGEATALGAAFAAGLAVGVWSGQKELRSLTATMKGDRFEPGMDSSTRKKYYRGWQRALERAKGWEENNH